MSASEKEDALALLTLAKVESAGALEVGSTQGGDGKAESGSKGLAKLGDGVTEGVEAEHLGARDGAGDNGFTEAYLDAGKSSLSEEEHDGLGRSVGIPVRERRGPDTNPKQKRAERLLPCLRESEGVDRRPENVLVVEQVADALANGAPGGLHRMVVNGAGLSNDALGLRASAYGPGISVLIDA